MRGIESLLTHVWHLAKGRWNVESHAIIATSPVVTRFAITIGHNALNTQRFETGSESSGAGMRKASQKDDYNKN